MSPAFTLLRIAFAAFQVGSHPDYSPFRPLDLPPPNSYRDGAGRPGPRYWQQRVGLTALRGSGNDLGSAMEPTAYDHDH